MDITPTTPTDEERREWEHEVLFHDICAEQVDGLDPEEDYGPAVTKAAERALPELAANGINKRVGRVSDMIVRILRHRREMAEWDRLDNETDH